MEWASWLPTSSDSPQEPKAGTANPAPSQAAASSPTSATASSTSATTASESPHAAKSHWVAAATTSPSATKSNTTPITTARTSGCNRVPPTPASPTKHLSPRAHQPITVSCMMRVEMSMLLQVRSTYRRGRGRCKGR